MKQSNGKRHADQTVIWRDGAKRYVTPATKPLAQGGSIWQIALRIVGWGALVIGTTLTLWAMTVLWLALTP